MPTSEPQKFNGTVEQREMDAGKIDQDAGISAYVLWCKIRHRNPCPHDTRQTGRLLTPNNAPHQPQRLTIMSPGTNGTGRV
jgi:hypothetical protein